MKLSTLAEAVGAEVRESYEAVQIERISSIDGATPGSIIFVTKDTYLSSAAASDATAVLVRGGWDIEGKICVEVKDPYAAYSIIAKLFEDTRPLFGNGVHESVILSESASVAPDVVIGPRSIIGDDVVIGAGTVIDANVVIEKGTRIGENCRIHSSAVIRYGSLIGSRVIISSGTVIGSEGFANAMIDGEWNRIPCFGTVEIEDDVEIGANTTIDRGNFENTLIKRGARIDNLVQVAHNCIIGKSTGIAAQAGFAGSTIIGERVYIGGQVGLAGHITIGNDVYIGAQSGVPGNVESGSKITGTPAMNLMTRRRIDAAEQKLPTLIRDVKEIKKELETLKGAK